MGKKIMNSETGELMPPVEQLQLHTLVNDIAEKYVSTDNLTEADELITIGALRLRLAAVPMFGSQQSDPLVSLIDELASRGIPMQNVPGSGPALLLRRKLHMPTPIEQDRCNS